MKPASILRGMAQTVAMTLLVTANPFAQPSGGPARQAPPGEPVASLRQVEGNLLVSQESGLASGDESLRLTQGSRVITTANSSAVVRYDDGCEVRLKENQRLEIAADKPCSERMVLAHSIFLEPGGIAAATAGAGTAGGMTAAALAGVGGAALGAAGLAGLAAWVNSRESAAASPS